MEVQRAIHQLQQHMEHRSVDMVVALQLAAMITTIATQLQLMTILVALEQEGKYRILTFSHCIQEFAITSIKFPLESLKKSIRRSIFKV